MMTQVRRFRRKTAALPSQLRRSRLCMEQLEDRSLLSAASLFDPAGAYDLSRIMVQFRPEVGTPDVASILPGSRLGESYQLVPGLREVLLPAGANVSSALAAFQANPFVTYAEPTLLGEVEYIPNDPLWASLYAMPRISAPDAWDYHIGGTTTVVAVMDTGVYYDHDDLYLNIWVNQNEIPPDRYYNFTDVDFDGLITFWDLNDPINQGEYLITDINGDGKISGSDILAPDDGAGYGGWADGYDADGNGRTDDLVGWDFVSNTRTPNDTFGHGTHVAGTVGAIGDNGLGVVGVNMRAQIMVLRIGTGPGINLTAATAAVNYAALMGVPVSNNSWGGPGQMASLRSAIQAAQAVGHIYVAAAGNAGTNNDATPFYPANYGTTLDNVISVAATQSNDTRASFSNYGVNTVHLGAPGSNIRSTLRNNGYGNMSGTSMAAPHVAGAVAYLFSAYPGIDYQTVLYALLAGVDAVGLPVMTGGRLNLLNSLFILWGGSPGGNPGGGGKGGDFGGYAWGEIGFGGGFTSVGESAPSLVMVAQALAEQEPEAAPLLLATPANPVSKELPPAVFADGVLEPAAEVTRVETPAAGRVDSERDPLFAELFGIL